MSNMSSGRGGPTIFELVERTRKFIQFELIIIVSFTIIMFLVHPSLKVHAGVAVAIFFGIFLVLQPWNYSSGSSEDRPYWMVGPPLIFFMVDLLLALMLHFGLKNELRPKTCKVWMLLQVGNLIQLTLLGFFMIWEIEFVDYSYLKLIVALLVLYLYKAYRISLMQKLVLDMNARCSITCIGGGGGGSGGGNLTSTTTPATINSTSSNNNEGSNISSSSHHFHHQQQHYHQIVNTEHILKPTFTISVQQPEATTTMGLAPAVVPNVKQESSA